MDKTQERSEALADELMALAEPDRLRRIWALGEQALTENDPGLPIVVGLVLRSRGWVDWAEYVLSLALKIPGARSGAMFELAVAAGLTGRPHDAVLLLSRLESEEPLGAYQQRTYAHQLARLGDREAALARLDAAQALEPLPSGEDQAVRQFFDYLLAFPPAEGLRRCEALLDRYRLKTAAELAGDVSSAREEGRGYAMIRMVDGEGAALQLADADESDFAALYGRNRREFHTVLWFGDDALVGDPDFERMRSEMNAAPPRADCLGAYIHRSLDQEYRWASIRGVPSMFNVVRKLEQMAESPGFDPERIALCHPDAPHALLFEGRLETLIRGRPQLGLVSSDPGLAAGLKTRFDLEALDFHHADPAEPFGARHARLSAELRGARPGLLYLVTELGLPGKVYCDLIKQAGGVALDVGGAVDLWAAPREAPDISSPAA